MISWSFYGPKTSLARYPGLIFTQNLNNLQLPQGLRSASNVARWMLFHIRRLIHLAVCKASTRLHYSPPPQQTNNDSVGFRVTVGATTDQHRLLRPPTAVSVYLTAYPCRGSQALSLIMQTPVQATCSACQRYCLSNQEPPLLRYACNCID